MGGETVEYEILTVDGRSCTQMAEDRQQGCLRGDVIVLIPGHGQRVTAPRNLIAAATMLSRSKVLWSIDVTPPSGGDPSRARALAKIVRRRTAALAGANPELPEDGPPPITATLLGYSHGGGEALLAADHDADLFPRVAGLCPTGLVERSVSELIRSFVFEALRIVWTSLRAGAWHWMLDTLRVGGSAVQGVVLDLVRTRRPGRPLEDIRWASRKVPGPGFSYPGDVVLLLADRDTVIRWQDVFPGCAEPDSVLSCVPGYRKDNFPCARQVEVGFGSGNHLFPEAKAWACAWMALDAVGQLDRSVSAEGIDGLKQLSSEGLGQGGGCRTVRPQEARESSQREGRNS